MAIKHPVYRDIYVDRGLRFSQIIELSVPFEDYTFEGLVKSSYTATTGIPIEFAAVDNESEKAEIFITAENTALLRRQRGVYDIFATNKLTSEVHKEREGTAHYANSASLPPVPMPPPVGYQITLNDVTDAGTAAGANIEDFATAAQGALAETALQPEEFRHEYDSNLGINYLGRSPAGSVESDETWVVTRITITSNGAASAAISLSSIAWNDRTNPLNYN